MRRRLPLLVVTACSALAVGCSGGGDKPSTLPSLIPTPVTSASPPAVPSSARSHSPAGAAAFVRFYFEQVSAAFSTADASALAPLSDPACSSCQNYIATAGKFRRDGQAIRGTAVRVISAEAPPQSNGLVAVDAYFDAPMRDLVRLDGSVIRQLQPDARYHCTVYVAPSQNAWVLRAVRRLPS